MHYEPRQMFVELEDDDVEGFVIIDTDDTEGYHIAEKWTPDDGEKRWSDYWLPVDHLDERLEQGHCKKSKFLTEKQFRGVLNLAGVKDRVLA